MLYTLYNLLRVRVMHCERARAEPSWCAASHPAAGQTLWLPSWLPSLLQSVGCRTTALSTSLSLPLSLFLLRASLFLTSASSFVALVASVEDDV